MIVIFYYYPSAREREGPDERTLRIDGPTTLGRRMDDGLG